MVQDTGGVLSLVQEENTSLSQLSSSPVSPPPLHPIPHPSEVLMSTSELSGKPYKFLWEGGGGGGNLRTCD